MQSLSFEKYLPIFLHVLAWVIYGVLLCNGNVSRFSLNTFVVYYGLTFTSHAIVFYLNFFFFIPQLLSKFYFSRFILANFAFVFTLSFFITQILHQGNHASEPTNSTYFRELLLRIINNCWFIVLSVILRFSADWFSKMQKQKELENEQLKTELSFLKAQINPHFLFNALNNLYALALKQAPETPTTIVQIAGIMRYLLYETNDEKVLLSKEIEIVQDYIALHELKNKSGIGISFKIQGNTDAMLIPPLLLLPLIENIFKHGTYPVNIRIHVTHQLTHQLFNLEAINKIRTTESKVPGGVGLINLKRRLDLLYRDNYQLALEEMGNDFRVSLTLNFNQLNP